MSQKITSANLQTFETQERSCELLLQGGVGGGPEVFSPIPRSRGVCGACWSGGSIADQEYTRLGDVGPRGSYRLLWHGAKLIRSSAQGRRNSDSTGEKGNVLLFSLWKKSHEDLKKFMMKQIDTMTCTRCNYPTYFKHVLDSWFHAMQRALRLDVCWFLFSQLGRGHSCVQKYWYVWSFYTYAMHVAHPWIFSNIATAIFIYKRRISIAMLELPKENMDSFGVFCVMPCCHAPVQLVVACICAHSQLHLIIVCVGTKPFFKIIFPWKSMAMFPFQEMVVDPQPLSLRLPR